MTAPNYPAANPAGRHRQSVREALTAWIDAQDLAGITQVYPSLRPQVDWDGELITPDTGCAAIVYVNLGRDTANRATNTGPDNPGGINIDYAAELRIVHRGWDLDGWDAAQDDYDRLVDSLKDCLRGQGRDLGRPDIIVAAADWPGTVDHMPAEPVFDPDRGTVDRTGSIFFDVYTYLPTWIPGEPI